MKALFVTQQDLVAKSVVSGNVDPDKLMQYIELAQDIHIQQQIGTDLYNKLQLDIINDTLAGVYLSLVTDHVKPMLINYAALEYLHFAAYTVANGGVYKHAPENAVVIEKNEVDSLIEKQNKYANFYTERFNRYMSINYALFPEYSTNTDDDMRPNRETNFTNWVL
jgi:hypothetical protein